MTCQDETRCGRPQDGPGHPRAGWIRTHVAGRKDSTKWWCSPACLVLALSRFDAVRHDVSTCPTCVNRHDRDHRCPACGSRPQVATGVATPPAKIPRTMLFQNLGHG